MPNITIAKDKRGGKEYSIEEICEIKKKDPSGFLEIKANLVCYECGIPQMTAKLGEINEHHYSKSPRQNHDIDCYYWGEEYTQKEVETIVDTLQNHRPSQQQVLNAFNQIQRYLNRENKDLGTIANDVKNNHGRPDITKGVRGDNYGDKNRKYIPRKKLTKKITQEDEGVWKIYYGEIGIKYKGSQKGFENYLIYANPTNSKDYRLSIGIHENAIFDEAQKKYFNTIKKKNMRCNLMVLGKVRIHKTATDIYNNISVYNSKLLRIYS